MSVSRPNGELIRARRDGGRIRLEPFAPLPRVARRDLEPEATRLTAFHA